MSTKIPVLVVASWSVLLLALSSSVVGFSPQRVQSMTRRTSRTMRLFQSNNNSRSNNKSRRTIHIAKKRPSSQPSPLSALRALFSSTAIEKPLPSTTTSTTSTSKIITVLKSTASWASFLCILDCTVLPLLTLVLPLVGWMDFGGALSSSSISTLLLQQEQQQQTLHVWSHNSAIFFVLPVGTATTVWNYFNGHRNPKVAALGIIGLLVICLSNGVAGGDWIVNTISTTTSISHLKDNMVLAFLARLLPSLPQYDSELWHRFFNILGCACLWASNFWSQQLGCDCGIPFCRPKTAADNGTETAVNLLLQVPSSPSSSTTTIPTTIPSAMAMQTRMIHYRQQLQRQQNQTQPPLLQEYSEVNSAAMITTTTTTDPRSASTTSTTGSTANQ